MKKINVVAAIIEKDGKYLAAERGYGEFEGKWEFPGGKIKSGETFGNSLKREIYEEMHADINLKDFVCTVEYSYPDFDLVMHCFLCSLNDSDVSMVYHDVNHLEHKTYKWLEHEDLMTVDWLPADVLAINKLDFYLKKERA